MPSSLRFSDILTPRPRPTGIDAVCQLEHFVIITYAFDPARWADKLPDRFELDTIESQGVEQALISVVVFQDVDFTSAVFPFPKWRMGQTNYRIYIVDRESGEKCVWFLGTTLDSWTRFVPGLIWKLPWHAGRIRFDCVREPNGLYSRYHMETRAAWAPAQLELIEQPDEEMSLPGYPDLETGLVCLTHPLRSYYHRTDGKLGSYCVWHQQLQVRPGRLLNARFGLLDRLGLVPFEEQQTPHSVLIEPQNEFTIYLPPRVITTPAVLLGQV